MDFAIAPDSLLPETLSPELVLVSPPEVKRLARSLLSPPPAAARVAVAPTRSVREAGAVELAAVWLFCLAMTVGPLLFTAIATS